MLRVTLALLSSVAASGVAIAAPLHDAVGAGDVEQVEALLDDGASPDQPGDNGETPLTLAILAGHGDVAMMLLEGGAAVGARNRGGFTPLHAAAYAGTPAVAAALLERGADADDRQNKAGVTALSIAAEQGHAEVAKVLINHGAGMEIAEQNGYTPLTRALWRNHTAVIAVLQAAGALCQPVEILDEPTHATCLDGRR